MAARANSHKNKFLLHAKGVRCWFSLILGTVSPNRIHGRKFPDIVVGIK